MKFEFKSLFDLQSTFSPDGQSCIDLHLENIIGDVIVVL